MDPVGSYKGMGRLTRWLWGWWRCWILSLMRSIKKVLSVSIAFALLNAAEGLNVYAVEHQIIQAFKMLLQVPERADRLRD